MKMPVLFLLLILILPHTPQAAQNGPPISLYFEFVSDQSVVLRNPYQNNKETVVPHDFLMGLRQVEREIWREVFKVFAGTDLLRHLSRIHIVLSENIPYGYCAFTPSKSLDTIYVSSKCQLGYQMPLLVAHELWHLLRNYHSSNSPEWMNEGLAELFASRVTGSLPGKSWLSLMNSGLTPPLKFDFSTIHHAAEKSRSVQYGFSQLFLTYLYDHFGGDAWLVRMLNAQSEADMLLSMRDQNNEGLLVSGDVLTFNSLFLNFAMAMNLNTSYYAQNNLFSLGGNRWGSVLRNYKMQPQFYGPDVTLELALNPYQIAAIRLASESLCLVWQTQSGSGLTRVYKLRNSSQTHGISQLKEGQCFQLGAGESLVVVQFEQEGVLSIGARTH